ncbi:hypothetical protein [Nocardioides mangrovi]|uniref:Class I SAM-dependent methyltransferase n=1 Tax=Nocardioides mangrovi TaxID=2874580 RepID=A0ABS7U8K8_9ACTN|nr:hypothetical protein [Nocardioides mangrovi]MBZ5737305.1 hypothetical protein [Nocardioides mangrovi]
MPRFLWVRRVDDRGIAFATTADRSVDVCVDDRRVWTFWSRRDTEARAPRPLQGIAPVRRVAWPASLQRHLDGRARISLRDSATGEVCFDRDVALGSGEGEILVQNRMGVDLGIDKSGRLVPTFAGRSDDDIAALLDATEAVLAAVRATGVEPFLAYGTLLGAVREGAVLGHDSDADLGYVSRHSDPVDVVRESFEIQRRLAADGWEISRYSGGAFKISVTEAEVTRGLDVFGGFLDQGRLYLMGEVGVDFDPAWVFPLGTAELEGRPMPVPARPEKFLEAMYGPSWKVPDPAFKFTTPERTIRAFDDWFRGTKPGSRLWDRRSAVTLRKPVPPEPSRLARKARKVAQAIGAEVVEVGAWRGSDSLWLARRGLRVTAYDYVPRALGMAQAAAEEEGLDLEARYLNLTEWRSVLAEGAWLARRPGPKVILARHVVDATSGFGRDSLARLCSMALRDGGQLLAEFYLPTTKNPPAWLVGTPDVAAFRAALRRAGATGIDVVEFDRNGRRAVRVLGEW